MIACVLYNNDHPNYPISISCEVGVKGNKIILYAKDKAIFPSGIYATASFVVFGRI